MSRIPLTVNGEKQLRTELEHLKTVERPHVIKAIAEARAHGDLKENAEYHAAREQQGFIEGRIKVIEATLSNAYVIDVTAIEDSGRVIFGTTVTLIDEDDKEIIYQLVGDDEADVKENKISFSSPIARGIIGKEAGDIVHIQTPAGKKEYEIAQVAYV